MNKKYMVSITMWSSMITTIVNAFHHHHGAVIIPTAVPRSSTSCIIQSSHSRIRNVCFVSHTSNLACKMRNSSEMTTPSIVNFLEDHIVSTPPDHDEETAPGVTIVPKTLGEAYRRFFFGPDYGPILIVTSITILIAMRCCLGSTSPLTIRDVLGFSCSVAFWSVQEHILHDKLLHSNFNWKGKQIHKDHHEETYFHISIDPPWIICTWLSIVFCIVCIIGRPWIPFPLGLSIVIGYTMSGLCYEWCHYIVHTKVPAKSKFFRTVKQHHIKHHLVNDQYWFGFTVPMMDDLFGTNPDVKCVMNPSLKK